MTEPASLPVEWRPREPPLAPVAVLARDGAVAGLVAATLARVESGVELGVAAAPGRLLVLGPAGDLPWAEGVTYLGDDDGLLVPTTLAPSLPAHVVRLALARFAPPEHLVAVAGGEVVTTPRPARPADAATLRALAP